MLNPSDRSSIDPAARAAAGIDAARASILIVDDRPDKLLVFRTVLEELDQNLYTATSGSDALRQVLYRDFAVILLDVNMPGIDGLETAALIRKRRKSAHTPIIFITSDFNDEAHQARGYALGAVDYIASPVVPEVLRAKVKVFVDLFVLAEQAKRQAQERLVLAEERAARAAAERATLRLEFLARASATLAASLDVDTTINALLELVVPAIADVGALTLTPAAGARAHTVLAWRSQDGEPQLERRVVDELTSPTLRAAHARASASGRAEIVVGATDAGEDIAGAITLGPAAVHTVIVSPLSARGRPLGVLSLASTGERRFDSDTASVVSDVANRAAIALDNAVLYRDIQEDGRRKSEFLAMLAHELRNPIAPIGNAVHVLNAGGLDRERVTWARDVIGRQLKQLVRLVDDLLDVSRITRGAIELKIEPLDVGEVVAAAVETSRPLIDQSRHALTVSMPPERLRAVGDFARVAQALANLINNAAKYTNPGGRISIDVSADGGEIVFRVLDSGIGIEPEYLSRIFEPFTQIDRSLDRAHGGLGIGLTLVRRLVELQGGSVTAASEGKDKGSEFVIRLPAAQAADDKLPSASAAEDDDEPLDGVRVVIVDDNRDVAESTALVLRLSRCDVQVAFDGRSGLDLVRAVKPDAVLVDIGLPGMDGFEVAKHIRAQPEHRRTLLVAVSGYGQGEHRSMSTDAGFDHHLVKPINPAALTHLLASTRPAIAPAVVVENPAALVARRTAD